MTQPPGTVGGSRLPDAAGRDFAAYNAAQAGRPVRELAQRAAEAAGAPDARRAVELGSGLGIEAAYLAGLGWDIATFDVDPSTSSCVEHHAQRLPITHRITALEDITELPANHLTLACATLPFVRREHFDRLWTIIRDALQPDGVLAVDLFGVRDDWADGDGSFHRREQVERLLDGLDVLLLDEREHDGRAFSGPKHWHTFRIIARRGATGSGTDQNRIVASSPT